MEILDWDEYCNLEKVKYFESQKKTVYKENLRVFGVGINDVDFKVVLPINGKPQSPASYATWKNMLSRCYNPQYHEKFPTYVGCSVSDEWKYFSNFNEWWKENYTEGYVLDKDIIDPNNKTYSKDTCIFIPAWLNGFVTTRQNRRGKYLLGVSWRKDLGKYMATCCVNGTNKNLGYFTCEKEAHVAWKKFKLSLVEDMKQELDAIHLDLYVSVLNKVESLC